MNILFINACVREESRTLVLAHRLLERLQGQVTELRLGEMNLKPLTGPSLARRDELLQKGLLDDPSLALARQFAQADCIVAAAPYWDLGFPALFKIYLELVTVSGISFYYQNGRPRGLCRAKTLYYVTTAGGPVAEDFGFAYLESLARNLYGIGQTRCLRAENLDIEGADVARLLKEAMETFDQEGL